MEAIGLYANGNILKLAHVKKNKNQLAILALESVVLPEYLDTRDRDKGPENTLTCNNDDPFGLGSEREKEGFEDQDAKNNVEYIIDLLKKYPVKRTEIGINLPESSVHFIPFNNSSALKGKKLRQKMIRESSQYEGQDDDLALRAEVRYVKVDENNYLIQSFAENIPVLETIIDAKPLIDNKLSVSLIASSEIALSHLEGLQDTPDTGRRSLIIYITNKTARLVFLDNRIMCNVSPVINFDNGGSSNLETIYAKILLMLDELGITAPDSIYIAGENADDQTGEFLLGKFPDVNCRFLTDTAALDLTFLDGDQVNDISSFAISIGLAAGMLNKTENAYENTNFLPKELKKEQRTLRLAWHGYAAMISLFLAGLFFTYQGINFTNRINEAEFALMLTEESLKTEREISDRLIEMESITAVYRQNISLVDSLWRPGPVYSGSLFYLSNASNRVNSLWINRIIMRKNFIHIFGSTIYRSRVHRFADAAGTAVIKNMESEDVRKSKIYNFELMGNPQDFMEPIYLDGSVAGDTELKNTLVFKREK